jgi:RNA polymerase II subunit A C-terminal domain phosphatase
MESNQPITGAINHYPLTVLSWKVECGDIVKKDQLLGLYEYQTETTKLTRHEVRSVYAGAIESLVNCGTKCAERHTVLGWIKEPCSHAVQLSGLCALCGQELTTDYLGNERDRATISLTHDALGVTVSREEATRFSTSNERLEHERAQLLLKEKKLSLLLDLGFKD